MRNIFRPASILCLALAVSCKGGDVAASDTAAAAVHLVEAQFGKPLLSYGGQIESGEERRLVEQLLARIPEGSAREDIRVMLEGKAAAIPASINFVGDPASNALVDSVFALRRARAVGSRDERKIVQ